MIDLACSSYLDNTIAWFKNLGGGLFGSIQVISTIANRATAVSIANVDGTGGFDVLSTSASPTNKVAWYGNGNPGLGNFGSQNVVSTAGVSPSSIRMVDLDGDGISDLVVTSSNDNSIAWLKGTVPTPGNPAYTRYVIASNQPRASAAAVADFDGDGWLDVVCAAPFIGDATSGPGAKVTCFRNTTHDAGATAPFFAAGQIVTAIANGVNCVVSADLNRDGRKDVLAATLFDTKVTWYENLGGGNFGWNAATPTANEKFISTTAIEGVAVAAADFDLNGTVDVVAGANTAGTIVAYMNRGGQAALSSINTANTAGAIITNGTKDDVLRLAVSNRGIAGDNNAQLYSVALLFEKSVGVVMSSAEANALIENLQIYVDSNASGAFEPAADALVGNIPTLTLTAGRLTATLAPANAADTQISPASTRHFFVVAEMTATASSQSVKTFRITHVSQGAGSTVAKDATSAGVLTVEYAANPDTPSSLVTASSLTIIQAWRQTWFGTTANSGNTADAANYDGDALVNLIEFAFGTNPTTNTPGVVSVNAGVITPGAPATVVTNTGTGVDFRALYGRRKDYIAAGLSYTVEFSVNLTSWTPSADVPTITADDGNLQAVTVPYPLFLNGQKARFFRVSVTGP